jgi:hypothetical protein
VGGLSRGVGDKSMLLLFIKESFMAVSFNKESNALYNKILVFFQREEQVRQMSWQ